MGEWVCWVFACGWENGAQPQARSVPMQTLPPCTPFANACRVPPESTASSEWKTQPLGPCLHKSPHFPQYIANNFLGSSKVLLTLSGSRRVCFQLLFTNAPPLSQMSNFLCCNVVSLGQWQGFGQLLVEFCNQRELCPTHRLVN